MSANLLSISPTYIRGGAIAVYENAWHDHKKTIEDALSIDSDQSIDAKFIPSQTNEDYKTGDPLRQSIRTSYGMSLGKASVVSQTAKEIYDSCDRVVASAISEYQKIFRINEEIKTAESYGLLRYKPNEKYNLHYDGGTASSRAVSALIYLNDDYEGGELEFANFDIKIKPKAGTLILFPSNYAYAHIAHPVISGTKYVIATWLKDR
jgi:Rps23 Pro-64 3,4-dihydroxylase Tpa1-like proline 4-hydroxylase